MSKLIVMVGLPGSGKSYVAKNEFPNYKVFSSDAYRLLICGDENCQDKNQEVFNALYRDLRLALQKGEDCIFDATNVTRKDRARIFNQIKGILNVSVIAYVMRTPLEVCVANDMRRERTVGYDVIKKFLYKYEFPQRFEGFSDIVIDKFTLETKELTEEQDAEITSKFFETIGKMKEWDQENPHHIHCLYDHCYLLAEQFPEATSKWFAGILHDVGKMFTKFYDDQSIAHYYNHDYVGTYYILSELLEFFHGDSQDFIEHLLFLVNYHMKGHKDFRGGNEKKYRQLFGDDWYDDLIAFADADMHASGTETIHNKLMQWIKVDKLTLDEIKNKEEFLKVVNGKTISPIESKDFKYVCTMSPEQLHYNILYHLNKEDHTKESRENAIKNIIFRSIRKWEISNQ